jgi:hypothetical protein
VSRRHRSLHHPLDHPRSPHLFWNRSSNEVVRRRLAHGVRRVQQLGDAGMSTAEYAIGTLAACGFAALLVTILRGSAVRGLLMGVITHALSLGS